MVMLANSQPEMKGQNQEITEKHKMEEEWAQLDPKILLGTNLLNPDIPKPLPKRERQRKPSGLNSLALGKVFR